MIRFSRNLKKNLTEEERNELLFYYNCLLNGIKYPEDKKCRLVDALFKVYHYKFNSEHTNLIIDDITTIIKNNATLFGDTNHDNICRHMELYLAEPVKQLNETLEP